MKKLCNEGCRFLRQLFNNSNQKVKTMFKNFFKVTLRSLLKSKLFVFINIIGLGLALACCIVAYLNYDFAMSYDEQHENYDEIYMVSTIRDFQGSSIKYGLAPMALGPMIENDVPGLKGYSRFERTGVTIKKDNNIFNRTFGFVDDDFLDMFSFPLKYGDKNSFKELSTVLISDRAAISLFGKEDAVGETLEVIVSGKPNLLLTVGGVFTEPDQLSTLQFQLISHFENFHRFRDVEKGDWTVWVDGIFIQTDNPTAAFNVPQALKKHTAAQNAVRPDFLVTDFWMVPMANLPNVQRDYNGTNLGNEALNKAHISAPGIMAFLILLLACFNFTNTAIAMSNKRLKEIGIRKTVGGSRAQMIFQFLAENLLLCLLALGFGLLFASWLVPKYSDMWPNMTVILSLQENPPLVIFLSAVLLGTALVAGGYPALYVSKFKPVAILRGTLKLDSSSILSKVLLGFQFMISVLALISGFAFIQNSTYQEKLDQGYDKESMLIVQTSDPSEAERFKAQIAQNPNIEMTASTRHHIGWGSSSGLIKSEDTENQVTVMDIGMDYIELAELRMLQGRSFSAENRETDRQSGVIINERMAGAFGWDDPLGKQVTLYDTIRYNVVGVVKDFYVFGLFDEMVPTMLRLRNDDEVNTVVVKVAPSKLGEMDDYLEGVWAEVIPDRPSNVLIHNQDILGGARDVNKNIVAIFIFLSIIAVILSAVGLFTLVSINILSRTKEIGIRKVLGASIPKITGIINRPFLIVVGISALLGAVAAYMLTGLLMGMIWTYHMQVNFLTIVLPVFSILLISFLSISGKVVGAAKRNPVESLRYE